VKAGIIGGTGFYDPGLLEKERDLLVPTPYGDVVLKTGFYQDKEVLFLPRHGEQHSVPPHLVNYRANIWALHEAGAGVVLATAAVGSLNKEFHPGEIVLVDQFLDFTKSRPLTFYEGGDDGVLHVDVTHPYCPDLRQHLTEQAAELQIKVHSQGTYVCTEGPRYETAAEIRMFHMLGGDLVGMTSVPEVVLAREAGLCYAALALVTNFAAGISQKALTHHEVVEVMSRSQETLRNLIFAAVASLPETRSCTCANAAAELGSLGLKKADLD
jgi:5'-methylthioadenosine phosphorylase